MDKRIAYGLITIKSFDDKTRTFKGIASTATPDRMQDVVEPRGAEFRLPLPFLHQHDSAKPVGQITRARVVGNDIEVDGRLEQLDGPPTLKERLDVAWAELKSGLVRGLSIGFNPKEYSFIKETGGIHFTKWEWLELSMVTIPANAEATITTIKSIASTQRAALGRNTAHYDRLTKPAGAAAFTSKGITMNTPQQLLAELGEARKTKHARMGELSDLRKTEKRAFSPEERTEFDGLETEIGEIDDDIRLNELHVVNISKAKPLPNDARRGAPYGFVKTQDPEDKFKGESFVRMVVAKSIASIEAKKGNYVRPSEVAERLWGNSHKTIVAVMKANEVAGGGSGSGEWGAELVQADTRFTGDFIEYLNAMTVFFKLPLRQIPANVVVKGQDGAATGYWVGESKPIPMSKPDFSTVSLSPLKVGALTVMSNELIRDSSPAALALVRDALAEASAQKIDTTFLSVTAASAGVSPAGILNGVSIGATNGADIQSIMTDFKALLAPFITAKTVTGLYVVTTPTIAAALGLMMNALGQAEFPGLTVTGGTFKGYPVVVGDNVGAGDFILMRPSDIWSIGDLGVQISVSQEATIEQSSAPVGATDTPVAMTQAMTSMFQEESTAIKVVRPINFQKRRSTAVAYIGNAEYGAEQS